MRNPVFAGYASSSKLAAAPTPMKGLARFATLGQMGVNRFMQRASENQGDYDALMQAGGGHLARYGFNMARWSSR